MKSSPSRWVVNASPLIVLSKVNQQSLLTKLAEEWVVPQAVVREIEAGPSDDPARNYLSSHAVNIVDPKLNTDVLAWDLGEGETAVLSYALSQSGWRVVIDDGAARRCARTFGLSMIGTLGIIIRASQLKVIPAAVPILHDLRAAGLRLDDPLIRTALAASTGESWPAE